MTEAEWEGDEEITLLALGTTVVRNRWRIARWMFVGASLALLSLLLKPAIYVASASFVPQGQGNDATRSGFASLAGQFGLSLPGNQATSPEFYASLIKSRVLLEQIARDTLVVAEKGGRGLAVLDLLGIPGGASKFREEQATERLRSIVEASVVKQTGVVQLSVRSKWPSVSLAIANALVTGVNDYNQRARQGQAAAERKFIEGRVTFASADLRQAEDRLEDFLRTNRQFRTSPDLAAQNDRIQREVSLKQQVFTSLTQAYEEARMREVRDTPVITVIEPPAVPTLPEPRGIAKGVLLGIVLGGFFAVLFLVVSESLARKREVGDSEAVVFAQTLSEAKSELANRLRWMKPNRG